MKWDRFEEMDVWKDARELCHVIFKLVSAEPFNKDYRFKDQIKAASGSIMDNIAEGFERGRNKEFIQFLFIAKASCGEVRSQCYRAFDYNYISQNELDSLLQMSIQLSKKIGGFINYLQKSNFKGAKHH